MDPQGRPMLTSSMGGVITDLNKTKQLLSLSFSCQTWSTRGVGSMSCPAHCGRMRDAVAARRDSSSETPRDESAAAADPKRFRKPNDSATGPASPPASLSTPPTSLFTPPTLAPSAHLSAIQGCPATPLVRSGVVLRGVGAPGGVPAGGATVDGTRAGGARARVGDERLCLPDVAAPSTSQHSLVISECASSSGAASDSTAYAARGGERVGRRLLAERTDSAVIPKDSAAIPKLKLQCDVHPERNEIVFQAHGPPAYRVGSY